jgi:hypothetical protein
MGGTQPLHAMPGASPAVAIIPSAPPSTGSPSVRARRGAPASVVAGVVLAVVGVVVLVAILVVHAASSRPKAVAPFGELDAGRVIVTGAPRSQASVVLAPVAPPTAETPDASDLAPLAPASDTPVTPAPMRRSRTRAN